MSVQQVVSQQGSIAQRVTLDGKFFREGNKKFHVKGLTYGPFQPHCEGEFFCSPSATRRDFEIIRQAGANVIRLYYIPPQWLLDLAGQMGLRLLVDIPWNKHLCFLENTKIRQDTRRAVELAAEQCAAHPAVFALSVVNEIPPDIVRWTGAEACARFIDELVDIVKSKSTDCLCTFGNFPPTEYLQPQTIDFHCYNVYLHSRRAFENYLWRLQMLADEKPLILGEIGVDSIREGEEAQEEMLSWQLEVSFRQGLAGAVVYSFSDEWFKEGQLVADWAFGITTADRRPKRSFEAVKEKFTAAPYFPLPHYPKVSVVIASYNGAKTLPACLESLQQLNYPDYEVILVDDGSTDNTLEIASKFPQVRVIAHELNRGLSAARNTGIQAAAGQIVAFTDADCRADRDWLYYLIGDLLNSPFVGVGGHNFLPPDDSSIAAAVMVSPGGPAHVMLTDRIAEHIPGCNMAFYKWALLEIGGFDPIFKKAGDDVDICWRLQQLGLKIGFSPAGFVWHYRRSNIGAYLKQQQGYGEAEALLSHRHPEYFNWSGGGQWKGKIYSPAQVGVTTRSPRIYHGWFGSAFFQTLYSPPPSYSLMLLTSFEYHVLVALPLLILGVVFPILTPVALAALALPLGISAAAGWQATIPPKKFRWWSRPLVSLLFLLQPIVRGAARYRGSLSVPRSQLDRFENLESLSREDAAASFGQLEYWNDNSVDRLVFLGTILSALEKAGWQHKTDTGWNNYDLEIYGSPWATLRLTTVSEVLGHGKQLIRCRLQGQWAFLSKLVFAGLIGLELLLVGLFSQAHPWIWLLLLAIPGAVWFLNREKKSMQRLIAVLLDEIAVNLKMKKLRSNPSVSSSHLEPKSAVRVAS